MPDYLKEAIELARQGDALAAPNPMVGAILVKEGERVGQGFHTYEGKDHAEVLALAEAGGKARGATLYINLEPCCHHGRTGPCTEKLIEAGVARVVAAMEDPNPVVAGKGFEQLRKAGVKVDVDEAYTADARRLNEPYVHFRETGLPLVTLKAAVTLDGKIAAPEDNLGWITSETARRHVHGVRHSHEAILTGIGTLLADDCRLTDRTGKTRSRPLMRIVLDSQLRIPLDSKMVKSCRSDVTVVTTSAASEEKVKKLQDRGVNVIVCDGPKGRTDARQAIEWLASENYHSLMIEAGSKVNWHYLAAGVVDKVLLYYAPKILGGLKSLPVVGGKGRLRRSDALQFENLTIHPIPPDEFYVEAYYVKDS